MSEKIVLACVKNEYEERRQQQPIQYQHALLRSQSEQHLSYNQETEHAGTLNSSLRTDASQVREINLTNEHVDLNKLNYNRVFSFQTVDSTATTMFNSAAYFSEDPAADRLFAVTNP